MRGMLRGLVAAPLLVALFQAAEPEPCPPCAGGDRAAAIRAQLEEAFAFPIATESCAGPEGLDACRAYSEKSERRTRRGAGTSPAETASRYSR